MPTETQDTRMALPPANYLVTQDKMGRRHVYRVEPGDGKDVANYGGVTGVLGIMAKPMLIPWATNQGLSRMLAAMICHVGGKLDEIPVLTKEIAAAIKIAKKSKKLLEGLYGFLQGKLGWKKQKDIKVSAQILAEWMEQAIKAPDEVKDAAADLGTRAHEYFELFCQGKAPAPSTLPKDLQPAVARFLKWIEESGLAIAAGDTKVASLKYRYGGALDCILVVVDPSKTPPELNLAEGDFVLGDYKTSNGIYDEYALQVSAYDQAFDETYGIRCRACIIIRFGKEQEKDEKGELLPLDFEAKWLKNPQETFKAFLLAKELQERMGEDHFIEPKKEK